MRSLLALFLFLAGVRCASGIDTLVTPNASPEAQSLLAYLNSIYGKKMLSGQHTHLRGTNDLGSDLTYIQTNTGKLPAVLSLDMMVFNPRRDEGRHELMQQVMNWYVNRNGIVSICWHWNAPVGERAFYTKDTKFDLSRGVTEGTPEYEGLLRDIDAAAGELKILRDARVPVMWRPLHEANGRWFWWGAQGPEPMKKLWRIMFDRLVTHHQLNNLIWVFSPGASLDLAEWYPGDEYVDMIGQDHYPMDGNNGPATDIFTELATFIGGNKLVGLSENGPIPALDRVVSEKAGWLFFTTWSGKTLLQYNSPEQVRAAYLHPHVLNLGDLGDFKNHPFEKTGRPVQLGFPARPSDIAVGGMRRRPLTVAVQDREGRIVREGSYLVTLKLGKHPSGANLMGTMRAPTINGIATFPDATIDKPGAGCTLVASAAKLRSGTSPAFQVGPGEGILRESWTAEELSGREVLTKALEVPVFMATKFTARYRATLLPPLTGTFTFWIANNGGSELWLSTDASPENKIQIAGVTGQTPYSKWPHTNEAESRAVELKAGHRYYLEISHTQNAGSGHLSVRWRMPGGIEERPIPGVRFDLPPAEEKSKVARTEP